MDHSPLKSRVTRGLSLALGLALIGGAALAAAAPASATVRLLMHVKAADIAPTETPYAGWHQGYSDVVGAFTDVPGGIEISGKSQMLYGMPQPLTLSEFSNAVANENISWSTTVDSDPVLYQVAVTFGDDEFTTLRPVNSQSGFNQVSASDIWTFSRDIDETAAGTELPLIDIIGLLFTASGNNENGVGGVEPQMIGVGVLTTPGTTSVVTGISWINSWWELGNPVALSGWAAVAGTTTLDQVLTATTGGWPEGTELSYKWLLNSGGNAWQPAGEPNTPTISVTEKFVGSHVSVAVTGTLDGYEPITVTSELSTAVTAPQRAAGAPPVADSSGLTALYAAAGVDPQTQTEVGLPAGPLSPAAPSSATIQWGIGDSFVDVFAYSTATFVGTYPVVNGAVSFALTPEILAKIGGGEHSLVLVGQTSNGVRAFTINVAEPASTQALAATGVAPALPLAVASIVLLLGTALIVARRRESARN